MKTPALHAVVGTLLIVSSLTGWAAPQHHCAETGPPNIWVVKSPYPFQAGTERTFDELYHGPWRASRDIPLSAAPRSHRRAGTIRAGTVVQALLGESIVVAPLRFIAARDYQVVTSSTPRKVEVATMHKGDVFWVLNLGGEGGFAVWWHCRVVGWDSTDAPPDDPNPLDLMGTNEEGWVQIRDPKTGRTGWFQEERENSPALVPAQPTTKSTG